MTKNELVVVGGTVLVALVTGYAFGAQGRDQDLPGRRTERRVASPNERRQSRREPSAQVREANAVVNEAIETDCARQRPTDVTTDMFMTMLRDEVDAQQRIGSDLPLEARANNLQASLSGWISGMNAVNPTAGRGVTEAIVQRLCSEGSTDLERLVMLRTIQTDLVGSSESVHRGIGCALDSVIQEGHLTEDVVTWEVLNAWAAHGRRPSTAIERIRNLATDERTLSRLDGSRQARRRSYEPEGL